MFRIGSDIVQTIPAIKRTFIVNYYLLLLFIITSMSHENAKCLNS